MSSQEDNLPPIGKIYSAAVKYVKNQPSLLIPFFIFATIELVALFIIFIAPRQPFIKIFGPPIRTFWGERFLHYPSNFLLLPKLVSLSRMFLSIVFGSLLSGMAISVVSDIYGNKRIKLTQSFNTALKKYISLFAVVLIVTLLYYSLEKITSRGVFVNLTKFIAAHRKLQDLKLGIFITPTLIALKLIIALFLQSAFIYTLPLLVIAKEKFIKAIGMSFILFKRLFIYTIILVGLPLLLFVPIIILNTNTAFLINNLFPESILLVSFFGIVVSSLLADPMITVTTTFLFLENRNK